MNWISGTKVLCVYAYVNRSFLRQIDRLPLCENLSIMIGFRCKYHPDLYPPHSKSAAAYFILQKRQKLFYCARDLKNL